MKTSYIIALGAAAALAFVMLKKSNAANTVKTNNLNNGAGVAASSIPFVRFASAASIDRTNDYISGIVDSYSRNVGNLISLDNLQL